MPRTAESLDDRIRRLTELDSVTGCWIWLGAKNAAGYGRIAVANGQAGGARSYAHRAAYEHYIGPIPAGLSIDHLCGRPSCCNPEHLEPVTQATNLLRGRTLQAANAAKTECRFGHEFTAENTRTTSRGRRCKECERRRARESYHRRK